MISPDTVLLIIDVQKGLDDPYYGTRGNPAAEGNMQRLLQAWRQTDRPVIHVQHLSTRRESPLHPGRPGCELKDEVKPLEGERVFQKVVNSAFIGTPLEEYCREAGYSDLVIVGLTAEHCVSTSVRMASNLGFTCRVVSDATASFDCRGPDGQYFDGDLVLAVSLATLHGEFATVLKTDEVLANL